MSADGKVLALGGMDGNVSLWNAQTGERLVGPTRRPNGIASLTISPDNQSLLMATGTKVYCWQIASGRMRGSPLSHDRLVQAVAISSDGRSIVSACQSGIAQVWDLETLQNIGKTARIDTIIWAIAFAPDGRSFFTADDKSYVKEWNLDGDAIGTPQNLNIGPISCLAFSGHGECLIAGARR